MADELLTALLNKIDSVLNGGDATVPKSPDNYISWCLPGIPFQPDDLQFAAKGINGADADETKKLIRNAAEFSRVVNAIPSSNVMNGSTFETMGDVLWDQYKSVLENSEVANGALTDAQKEKIEKFRKLLTVTKKTKDLITDEEKEVQEDSPMVQAYNEQMAAYTEAALEYNNRRLSALNEESKQVVQDFSVNGANYRAKVKAAMGSWVSKGYKKEVESMYAFIQQMNEKSMVLLKDNLKAALSDGAMTDPDSNREFYLSSFYPGSFMDTNKGWTKFSFNSSAKDTYLKETKSSTSGAAGSSWGFWGLWSTSASGGKTTERTLKNEVASDFTMEFSIVQVPIGRGWFQPSFFMNKGWRFAKKSGIGQPLSDGAKYPKGSLIAYPTMAIFVKDIKITSKKIKDFYDEAKETVSGGSSIGWGPFRIGGSHSSSSHEKTTSFSLKNDTLTVDGMQLIAFKCFALPKSPDPNPDIKESDWV